jgi:hypothetical protein
VTKGDEDDDENESCHEKNLHSNAEDDNGDFALSGWLDRAECRIAVGVDDRA